MANWLRDADTGELFREDELDPSSYDPVSEWQPLNSSSQDREYQYPEWLTSGLGTTVPARSLASLARGGAGFEQLVGDLASNIPGLENNLLQRDADTNRKMADDLVAQSMQENNVTPGSWQDIGGAALGEALPSLGTMGYGLARGAGKAALAFAPTILPGLTRYDTLTEEGVSGPEAALAAGGSMALNSLLNRIDVGAALQPGGLGARLAKGGSVGAATNLLGAYGDALGEKWVGAPQTKDEFIQNALASTIAGGATGAGFAALPTKMRGALDEGQALEGQSLAEMQARMEADPNFDSAPPTAKSSLTIDSELPIIDQRSPTVEPLIQVEEAYRARDLAGRQRQLEDLFLPEDSELAPMRESAPTDTREVIDPQRTQPSGKPILQSLEDPSLSPEERQIVRHISGTSPERIAKAQIAQNEAELEQILAKRAENRRGSSSSGEATLILDDQGQSFPEPLIKNTVQAQERPPTDIVTPPGTDLNRQPSPAELLAPSKMLPEQPSAPSIETVEVYKPKTPIADEATPTNNRGMAQPTSTNQLSLFNEPQVANIKSATPDPVDSRNALGKRLATRRKAPVGSREAGYVDVSWIKDLGDWLWSRAGQKKTKAQSDLPDYKDWSAQNQKYDSVRGAVEWIDTTRSKNPEAAGYIDAHWKIPQDISAVVYDANETLRPYTNNELSKVERKGVDNYLQAARVLGSRDKGYKVTAQTAAKAGLAPKQVEAALAVNRWSNFMLDLLENHAIAGAEHDSWVTSRRTTTPEGKAKLAADLDAAKKEIAQKFSELRDSNYVPFNRYGDHFINVIGKDGKLLARYQFDKINDPEYVRTKKHFENLAKQSGSQFEGAKVQYGRKPPAKLNKYDGVSSDILDLLNDDSVKGEIQGFYKHLKPAALVPGQNVDVLRAVSEYTVGAARLMAFQRAERAGQRELATNLFGADKTNLARKLTQWSESLNQPTSAAFKHLNEAFNLAYIGGNLRTPTADLIGRVQLQYPLLAKYVSGLEPERVWTTGINKELQWWFDRSGSFGKKHPELSNGIKEAQRKGIIPTNIYKTFIRAARGDHNTTMSTISKVKDAYFGLKEISERSTDLGGFILGWEAYGRMPANKRAGIDRQTFAENFVRESRAVPTQGELPAIAPFKSETGRLALKYKTYKLKILKSLAGAGYGQVARYMLATGFTTGLAGLPFAPDLMALSRGLGTEPEDKLREAGLGSGALYGPLSKATGIDFHGAAGFGETFPGQASNPVLSMAVGVLGAPADQAVRAMNYHERGQNLKALASLPFMPNPISNIAKAADYANRGVMTMGGQAIIPRDDVRLVDVLKKAAGYQPLAVQEGMVTLNRKKQEAYKSTNKEHLNQRIGEALGLGDFELANELRTYAVENGIKLNKSSIKQYQDMARGLDRKYPKAARQKIQELQDLYSGNN